MNEKDEKQWEKKTSVVQIEIEIEIETLQRMKSIGMKFFLSKFFFIKEMK